MTHPHADTHCQDLLELIAGIDDENGEEVERILAAHIARCPACAAEEHRLGDLITQLRRTAPPDLPTDLEARLLARLCSPN